MSPSESSAPQKRCPNSMTIPRKAVPAALSIAFFLAGPSLAQDKHWAFQPITPPRIPAGQHPIDALVSRTLRTTEFQAVPPADLHTLVRRLCYDLHGLPPTPVQQKIAQHKGLGALADVLLASPHYGERWGRHWLDVARYADTKDGVLMYGDTRIRPFAYTYRDYVIRSFNQDKPFDRFVHEQLAADQLGLGHASPDLAAMGFLTLGRMFDRNRHDIIDDQIDVVTRGLLGLTVACARCHDHKFDPIPTADYYSLYGVFASSEEPVERPRIEAPSKRGLPFEADYKKQLAKVNSMLGQQHVALMATARERTERYLLKVATSAPDISETSIFFLSLLPKQLRPQIVHRWRKHIADHSRSGDPVFGPWHDLLAQRPPGSLQVTLSKGLQSKWKQQGVDPRIRVALAQASPTTVGAVVGIYDSVLQAAASDQTLPETDPLRSLLVGKRSPTWFPLRQTWYYMSRKDKDAYRGLVRGLDILAVKSPHAAARAMSLTDTDELFSPVIFRRGDPTLPGRGVPRQFLEVLAGKQAKPFPNGSGRRDLAFAITSPDNPLTARVLANRIWMHHFGEPLVPTPSDFGLQSERPVQMELLDFLADQLTRGDWRLKSLHKLIVTSATWQQSSLVPDSDTFTKQLSADPTNSYLWKANRRRLDLEAFRDTLLAVSGQLDPAMFGRPASITSPENRRRTVYSIVERQNIPDVVRNFDFASPDCSIGRRQVTTVPQQALFLLNSDFVTRTASALAKLTEATPTGNSAVDRSQNRIDTMYRLAFQRSATAEERSLGRTFSSSRGWAQYAQVLLMTNELMFVD
ncbi:MAG TPA: hypothetical protein DCE43_08600 [Planctomycetaceae bacterium]|nr:hypothetical protein [Planctomycetaceae bacterium]